MMEAASAWPACLSSTLQACPESPGKKQKESGSSIWKLECGTLHRERVLLSASNWHADLSEAECRTRGRDKHIQELWVRFNMFPRLQTTEASQCQCHKNPAKSATPAGNALTLLAGLS